jgi:hypothetical protein
MTDLSKRYCDIDNVGKYVLGEGSVFWLLFECSKFEVFHTVYLLSCFYPGTTVAQQWFYLQDKDNTEYWLDIKNRQQFCIALLARSRTVFRITSTVTEVLILHHLTTGCFKTRSTLSSVF